MELCRGNGIACREADSSLTEVYGADEVFSTGTMGELAPVTRVDGRSIGNGAASPGPVTRLLGELFRELTGRSGVQVVNRPA